MAERKPLVLNGGQIEQIQAGDTLPSGLITETDPIFANSAAYGIDANDISNWDAKLDANGDGANLTNVVHTETDPVFANSDAAGIDANDISNWDAKLDANGDGANLTNVLHSESIVASIQNANDSVVIPIVTPTYVTATGKVDKAKADSATTTKVLGFARAEIAANANGDIQTDGFITATTGQWDAITGDSGGLTPGSSYYLSAATAGQMTKTAPSTTGQYVAELGTAILTTKFEIRVEKTIKL